MVRGLYTAATGMNVQSKKIDVISNDLANANTTGYKKDTTIISSFSEQLMKRMNDYQNNTPNNKDIGKITWGAKVVDVYTDFTQGSVINTNEKFDLAIQGDGFFVIGTPNGVAYTRDGNFTIDKGGNLVTRDGYSVMGEDGPISFGEEFLINGSEVTIREDGEIYTGAEYIDRINVVNFEDKTQLKKMNDNLYTTDAATSEFRGSLIQGFLESANVNPVNAMVDMIKVSRTYEANQKALQTADSLLGKAVDDIGRA